MGRGNVGVLPTDDLRVERPVQRDPDDPHSGSSPDKAARIHVVVPLPRMFRPAEMVSEIDRQSYCSQAKAMGGLSYCVSAVSRVKCDEVSKSAPNASRRITPTGVDEFLPRPLPPVWREARRYRKA